MLTSGQRLISKDWHERFILDDKLDDIANWLRHKPFDRLLPLTEL
jgi:hypothetical protein